MSLELLENSQEKIWKEWYLGIQGFFYFAQGVAMAAIALLPNFMIQVQGLADETAILYQTVIYIPWLIKLFYGLLSDNVAFGKFGRRRPYILIAGILGIAGWFTLPLFTTFNPLFLVVGILLSLCISLSDAVIDSLAVDITPERRRGWMQGVGWGGRGIGMALAGFVLGRIINSSLLTSVSPYLGWQVGYFLPGGLVVIACLLGLLIKEPKLPEDKKISQFEWSHYKSAFSRKDTWIVTLFMLIAGAGLAVMTTYNTYIEEQSTLNIEGIGLGVTAFALGMFLGAMLMGALGQYLPLLWVFIVNTLMYVGIIVGLIFVLPQETAGFYIFLGGIGAINGGYEATQMRIGMEYSQGPIGGTLYNWYMSLSNIGTLAIGPILISQLSEDLGGYQFSMQFASMFLLLAVIPGIIIILWLKKARVPKVVPVEEPDTQTIG